MHGAARRERPTPPHAGLIAVFVAAGITAAIAPATGAPRPIQVLVFNIHAGKDAAGKSNLDGVGALVQSTRADLVLLQEVDRNTARSGSVDQVAVLAQATGYATAFAPSLLHYDGGEYGVAVLSRFAIAFHATVPLPVLPPETRAGGSQEPRVALLTFLQQPTTAPMWHVLNTHLDPADGGARAQEIARLLEAYRDQSASREPILVGGDFNSTPDNPVLQPLHAAGLRDAWTECGSGAGFTYPADTPVKRIDYLFLSGDLHCAKAEVLDSAVSDHRPLLVSLK